MQIPFQAEIRASKLSVRVVRFARFGVCGAFVQIAFVLFKPCLQTAFKVGSAAVFER